VPENRSRYEFTLIIEPMLTGLLSRTQAPETEVSSSLAGQVCCVPNWSCQDNSTSTMVTVRGSIFLAGILNVFIGRIANRFNVRREPVCEDWKEPDCPAPGSAGADDAFRRRSASF
jgi:hypothetical protein